MNSKLSLKILYRTPVRTILTFILLAAVTFALFSQVMEYSVVKRETEKMVDTYQGVGIVENGTFISALNTTPAYMYSDPRVPQGLIPDEIYSAYRRLGYEHFPTEAMNKMLDIPYITYADTRYMTAGLSEFRRVDEGLGYYDYTNICVAEGTITDYHEFFGRLTVSDLKLIGGEPIPYSKFGEEYIYIAPEPVPTMKEKGTPVYHHQENSRAVVTATENSKYTPEFIQSLEVGKRYVFVLRYEDDFIRRPETYTYYLTDPFVYSQCNAVYPLENEPENYLETEKFAPLREYIGVIEADQYTLDMVYTTNMESIRYLTEEKIGINEGRAITADDTQKKNNVCVISAWLAYTYDLEVGDRISLRLGNRLFSQIHSVGAISAVKERTSTSYTLVELEIVGICMDTRNKYAVAEYNEAAWSYSANTVFVPQHLLNVSDEELENHTFHSGEVSFVVEDAWDIPEFIETSIPIVENLGYTMHFNDDGFMDIYESLRESNRIAIIRISVLLFAVAVVTWFISMLFVVGRKRDYAIMRLLGTEKKRATKSLLLPLGVISVFAVLCGTVAAYINTVQNIANSQYLNVISGIELDLSISPIIVISCIAGEFLLALLLAMLLISIIGRKSPLELTQSDIKRVKVKHVASQSTAAPQIDLSQLVSIERPKSDGTSRSVRFILHYISRHIRRTAAKAFLFILVAVLLLNVLGQLIIMRNSYIEIFESTVITSQFTGYLSLKYVDQLIHSGYTKDVYYCTDNLVTLNRAKYTAENVTFCCDIEHYAESKGIENLQITWLEGYDASSLYGLSNVILIGEDFMIKNGLELGEVVEISKSGEYFNITAKLINDYRQTFEEYTQYSDEEIIELHKDEIFEKYSRNMETFTVIGIMHNSFLTEKLISPGSPNLSADFGSLIIPPTVSATLADNYKAADYRAFAEEIEYANRHSDVVFIMDTTKIENVKNNIELLRTLYPIMVIAVFVIGAFLCGLIIVQTSKDIAIMRVLGTSKAKTRTMLVLEQMILCVVGIIISCVILYIRGALMQMLWVLGAYALVILLASIVASIAASRKNVLELLQTKE